MLFDLAPLAKWLVSSQTDEFHVKREGLQEPVTVLRSRLTAIYPASHRRTDTGAGASNPLELLRGIFLFAA